MHGAIADDCMEAGGRAMHGAIADDCMEAGGRVMHGAIAEFMRINAWLFAPAKPM